MCKMLIKLKTTNPDPQGNTQGLLTVRNVHDEGFLADVKAALVDWKAHEFAPDNIQGIAGVYSKAGVTVTLYARTSGKGRGYVAMGPTVEAVIAVCAGLPKFPADQAMALTAVPEPA
jgi:hypothetical protein